MRTMLAESTERLADVNRELEDRVAERTRELQSANKEIAAFSYAVSHDLRAPLRTINGYCTILESEQPLDDDGRAMFDRMRAATARMDALIEGLLTLARLSAHSLQREDIDISATARDFVAELRESAPQRKVQIDIEEGLRANGDRSLLRSVLANLIANAWKYGAGQDDARIVVRQEQDQAETVFVVEDNGPGFDPDHASKLFAPFQRLHNDERFDGTGIGLATVRRILELHGGKIWARAAPGHGARFYFTVGKGSRTA